MYQPKINFIFLLNVVERNRLANLVSEYERAFIEHWRSMHPFVYALRGIDPEFDQVLIDNERAALREDLKYTYLYESLNEIDMAIAIEV